MTPTANNPNVINSLTTITHWILPFDFAFMFDLPIVKKTGYSIGKHQTFPSGLGRPQPWHCLRPIPIGAYSSRHRDSPYAHHLLFPYLHTLKDHAWHTPATAKTYFFTSFIASSARFKISSISSPVCAVERNQRSNADGWKKTPRLRIAWQKAAKGLVRTIVIA